MPIRIEPPEDLAQLEERVLEAVGATFGSLVTMSTPYRVETVELEWIARQRTRISSPGRWQCLVGNDEPAAAIDIRRERSDYVVISVNHGELATRFNDAVTAADEISGSKVYELRALEVPGLHFAAVHLLADEETSLFIPALEVPGAEPALEVLRAYSSGELFESLRPAAERALSEWRG